MNTYQWVGIIVAVLTLFGGQVLASVLAAFVLWFKTKNILKVELEAFQREVHTGFKTQGLRLGNLETEMKSTITNERCNQCQIDRERIGNILVEENRKEHGDLKAIVDSYSELQKGLLTAVSSLTSNVENLTKNVEKLFELWNEHMTNIKRD